MRIAIAAEPSPAKTFIPLLKKLSADFVCLAHGSGVEQLLKPYCENMYYIGESRRSCGNKLKIVAKVLSDIKRTIDALRESEVDLLLTCGNAGDTRKGISAAKILGIPVIHIEQDIYNPIELIAFANFITTPSERYKKYLESRYMLRNVKNIGGYPHAIYVRDLKFENKQKIRDKYGMDEFILAIFGGDLRPEDIPPLVNTLEILDKEILIAPFRFDKKFVEGFISSSRIRVLDEFVELLHIMNAAEAVIYSAGMGVTIEVGVLGIPSIKVAGFHYQHASIDLCKEIGIPVVKMEDIVSVIDDLEPPNSSHLLSSAESALEKLIDLIKNFQPQGSCGGFKSLKKIWEVRSKFK